MISFGQKALLFTDIHFGIHSNNPSFLQICSNTMKWICEKCENNDIKDVIFMGDFFDSRASIDVKTLNSATQSLYSLADNGINVTMILGNHDIYLRDSTSIHSLLAFGGHSGIVLVDKPQLIQHGDYSMMLLPWMFGTPSNRVDVPCNLKYVFSHHNFPNNFFMNGTSKKTRRSDTYVSKTAYEDELGLQQDIVDTIISNSGVIFSGHIHQRNEIPIGDSSKLIIEGSPYETSWGFNNKDCGVYVINFDNGHIEFIPNEFNMKHVEIRTSSFENDMNGVDFEHSIIRLNVDTQESFDTISKIQSKINSQKPFSVENTKYEFTAAEFVGKRDISENPLNSITHQVSTKLDYVYSAIDKSDFSKFDYFSNGSSVKIQKERLKVLAKTIYDNVEGR